jgi:hypothetical protein
MDLQNIKELLDSFDPAALLPEMGTVLEFISKAMGILVLVGPLALLVLGLAYLFVAPKEANHSFGYRCFFGMGSVEAWRYTQRMAGLIWTVLGLVLTVAAFIARGGFPDMDVQQVISGALSCLLWQAGLIAVSCIAINTLAAVNFTADGDYRRRRS